MNAGITRTLLFAIVACAVASVAGRPARAATPDYSLLDEVLIQNVRNGYVDYDGIAANPKFEQFIAQLADPPDALPNAAGELAYYINAYNALAIRGILDGHSPASRFGRFRFFRSLDFRLGGDQTTLEDLEHKHIRPLGDPRVHFAIVCASISCPRLSNRAYLPETVDAQLDEAAQRFVNDITRNQFDITQRTAFLSRIFEWYRTDFEQAAGSLPGYLARYVQEPATRAALRESRLTISYLPYDWDLNGRYAAASER